jgi:hypothetical protein
MDSFNGTREMAEIETANVVPLNPAPAKPKSRVSGAKRTRATRSRQRRPSPLPTATPAPAAATDAIARSVPVIHPVPRDAAPNRFLAVAVFAVGLVTAAVGLYLNASFLWKFGRTSESGVVFAVVGLVTDTITLVLPATVMVLWQQRRRGLALTGCCMYAIAVAMTLLTAVGFAATNIDDAIAGRDAATVRREALRDDIVRLKAERNGLVFAPIEPSAVTAAQVARDQECGRVGPNCRQRVAELNAVLRDRAAADRVAEIDASIAAQEASLNALPALASADPQTEAARAAVIWLSGGHLTASSDDIRMTRVLGIAAVLFMAGLLLAFGTALRQPGTRQRST